MAEFVLPEFLQNCDVDTIHAKMLSMLPEDIDKTEGGFAWDFTRPTALIASELLEFYAVELLKLVFPQYSSGAYLDMLAAMVHVTRQEGESDESLRTRVIKACFGEESLSCTGCVADYKRWAEEVAGVGAAIVIPEKNGPGTVGIICTDTSGDAADAALCQAVYDHIMSPDAPLKRLAPIGATVEVLPPEPVTVNYAATVSLADGYTAADVEAAFASKLAEYYREAAAEGTVRYIKVLGILISLPGVEGFTALAVNGSSQDIALAIGSYPVTGTVTITAGGAGNG